LQRGKEKEEKTSADSILPNGMAQVGGSGRRSIDQSGQKTRKIAGGCAQPWDAVPCYNGSLKKQPKEKRLTKAAPQREEPGRGETLKKGRKPWIQNDTWRRKRRVTKRRKEGDVENEMPRRGLRCPLQ